MNIEKGKYDINRQWVAHDWGKANSRHNQWVKLNVLERK